MRCPECKAMNAAGSSICPSCGLLLMALEHPRRRRDDLRQAGRRSVDGPRATCRYCASEIDARARRCPTCSEILDAQDRVEEALRRRAQINYASWIAYLGGLIALLIFRPVGMIAIGAGLLLSIAYYAVPVEAEPAPGESRFRRLLRTIRQRVAPERVPLRLPLLTRGRLVVIGTPLLVAVTGFLANFVMLQHPMNQVIRENPSLQGVRVSAHYAFWVVPGVVVYDLEGVDGSQSRLDVHTAFLEYAKKMKSQRFREVQLSYRGQRRFSIDGESFRRLGQEYANENLSYALFEFPRNVDTETADAALDGRDALMSFHDRWYAIELLGGR